MEATFDQLSEGMGWVQVENGLFKCLECSRTFKHKRTAKRHYSEKHVESLQSHECPYCQKKYPNLRYLKMHLSNHCQMIPSLGREHLWSQDQQWKTYIHALVKSFDFISNPEALLGLEGRGGAHNLQLRLLFFAVNN